MKAHISSSVPLDSLSLTITKSNFIFAQCTSKDNLRLHYVKPFQGFLRSF